MSNPGISEAEKQKLREAAEATQPGDWIAFVLNERTPLTAACRTFFASARDHHESVDQAKLSSAAEADATFIALASPSTVLALLDECEQVTRERDEARSAWDAGVASLTKASYAQVSLVTNRLHDTEAERDSAIARAEQAERELAETRDLLAIERAACVAEIDRADKAERERDELLAVARKCPSCKFVYSHTSINTIQDAERDTAEAIAAWLDEKAEHHFAKLGNGGIAGTMDAVAQKIRAGAWRKS